MLNLNANLKELRTETGGSKMRNGKEELMAI